MGCKKTFNIKDVMFATNRFQLVNIVFMPTKWMIFTIHTEEFQRNKKFFSNFPIQHISKAKNTTADKLVCGARTQFSTMIYVNSFPSS